MNSPQINCTADFSLARFPSNFILLTFRNGYAKFSLIKKKKFLMWCTAIVPNGTELWAQKKSRVREKKRLNATF